MPVKVKQVNEYLFSDTVQSQKTKSGSDEISQGQDRGRSLCTKKRLINDLWPKPSLPGSKSSQSIRLKRQEYLVTFITSTTLKIKITSNYSFTARIIIKNRFDKPNNTAGSRRVIWTTSVTWKVHTKKR